MTLSFYCKKVIYLVSKHTKRYLKGNTMLKIRLRQLYYTVPTKYHLYIKVEKFPPPLFENFCIFDQNGMNTVLVRVISSVKVSKNIV